MTTDVSDCQNILDTHLRRKRAHQALKLIWQIRLFVENNVF